MAVRKDKPRCPECGNDHLWKIGMWVGRKFGKEQRYKCQNCGRAFLAHLAMKRRHGKVKKTA